MEADSAVKTEDVVT